MKTWKFRLQSNEKIFDFGADLTPTWSEIKRSLITNEDFRGAQFEMTSVFEFIGAARSFIRDVVDSGGIDSELFLSMWTGNESGHKSSFKKHGRTLKASFGKSYKIDDVSCFVSFSISGFEELILNRKDTTIQYQISEAIDGEVLDAPIYRDITMHDRVIDGFSSMKVNMTIHHAPYYAVLINEMISNSTAEVQTNYTYDDASYTPIVTAVEDNTKVHIVIKNMSLFIHPTYGNKMNYLRFSIKNKIFGAPNSFITYFEQESPTKYDEDQTMIVNCDFYATINKGDNIVFFVYNGGAQEPDIIYTCNEMTIDVNIPFRETQSKAILPFDAFTRIVSQITGKKNAFKSDFLNYNKDVLPLGDPSLVALMDGLMVRSFPINEALPEFSLSGLLDTFQKLYNLIAWIENDVFRLEPYDVYYDFNNVIEIDVKSVVEITLIEKMHYSNIKYGYTNVQLEEVNGLDSHAGEIEAQTHLKSVKNELDLVIKDIANDYAIEFTRRKDYQRHPKEDYRFDKNIFLVECNQLAGGKLETIRGEEYGTIEGILSPNTAYNIGLRTSKQFDAWESVINSGLYLQAEKSIKFVRGANNTKLSVDGVLDVKDRLIKDLKKPRLLPYKMDLTAIITDETFNNLVANPRCLLKVGNLFGVIEEFDYDVNTNECEFKLIRANR